MHSFDVIVVGGGHAGTEAAAAAARMGANVCLLTSGINDIGAMSCNPSMGGIGKGHIIREIDAMDGLIGKIADMSAIHCKVLNTTKGYAVQGVRTQNDRKIYMDVMQKSIMSIGNITPVFDTVYDLIIEDSICIGILTNSNSKIFGKSTVITTGTFLGAKIQYGTHVEYRGRWENAQIKTNLESTLTAHGIDIIKLKTGTPPRLDANTINWSKLEIQCGDKNPIMHSFLNETGPVINQVNCYITRTNKNTHQIIRNNLHLSPIHKKEVDGVGPRYCPCIEDKITRFSRDSHQVFLEPEGLDSTYVYPNGISMSLPEDIQFKVMRSINGLENVNIVRPGYAVNYSCLNPNKIFPTLASKKVGNLFLAGQVNGTTGYEEAAGQGLIAGINSALLAANKSMITLQRNTSYIGVMIDDITSRELIEPYRMFTSRSEYRLNLRPDNADKRLTELGFKVGVVSKTRYHKFKNKYHNIDSLLTVLKGHSITPHELRARGYHCKLDGKSRTWQSMLSQFDNIEDFLQIIDDISVKTAILKMDINAINFIRAESLYKNYLPLSNNEIEKFNSLEPVENIQLQNVTFDEFSSEVQEMLNKYKPKTLHEARNIPGITPYAILRLAAIANNKNHKETK